jgi:hypothetical protein
LVVVKGVGMRYTVLPRGLAKIRSCRSRETTVMADDSPIDPMPVDPMCVWGVYGVGRFGEGKEGKEGGEKSGGVGGVVEREWE